MRNNMLSWGSRLVTSFLALVLAIVGLTLFASPAHAEPSPPPSFTDLCGTASDTVTIPNYIDNTWKINGVIVEHGMTHPAPSTSVVVTAEGMSPGSWPYEYTNNGPCSQPAPNTYSVVVGKCQPTAGGTGRTLVNALVGNTGDEAGLPLRVDTVVRRVADGFGPTGTDFETNIADGEVRTMPLGRYDGGLHSGTFTIKFFENQNYQVVAKEKTFFVPACGKELPPNGDPAYGNGGSSFQPKGKVKQIRGTTNVRGKAINKRVAQKTKFVLIINPKVGKTIKRVFTVKAGQVFKIKPFAAKIQTRVTLKATVNGKLKRVSRVTVTSQLSR